MWLVLLNLQGGAADSTTYFYDSAVRTDGSVVIAGLTYGDFDGTDTFSGATTDFIALALNEHGQELWRWQVTLLGVACFVVLSPAVPPRNVKQRETIRQIQALVIASLIAVM